MPILSKMLSIRLMKEAVAFETLWLHSVVLCLLDEGKKILFFSSEVFKLLHCQEIPGTERSTYISLYPETALFILWRYRITVWMGLSSLLAYRSVVFVADREVLGLRLSTVTLGFGDYYNQIFTATTAKSL